MMIQKQSGMPWIHVYTNIIDNPSLAMLTEAQCWRMMQLEILAGECDAGGLICNDNSPLSVLEIAWRLRIDADKLAADLDALQKAGIVDLANGVFMVGFEERQGPTQDEKRAAWRERTAKKRANVTGDTSVTLASVTDDASESHTHRTEQNRENKIRAEQSRTEQSRTETPFNAAAAAAADFVLSFAGIKMQALKKYPAITAPALAAWYLYAYSQGNIEKPSGYAIKRAQDAPPPDDALELLSALPGPNLPESLLILAEDGAQLSQAAAQLAADLRAALDLPDPTAAQEQTPPPSKTAVTIPPELVSFWKAVLDDLEGQVTKATFDAWLRDTKPLCVDDGVITVQAKNSYAIEWLESRLLPVINRTVERYRAGAEIKFVEA
jgi:hypothetical protein